MNSSVEVRDATVDDAPGISALLTVLAWKGRFAAAAVLAALVFGEIVVLWLNQWRCPLTAVAARYTSGRHYRRVNRLEVWGLRWATVSRIGGLCRRDAL